MFNSNCKQNMPNPKARTDRCVGAFLNLQQGLAVVETRNQCRALAVYSVTMCAILITIYVRPYQEATGTLTAGGGINWLSGESMLVLAGPVVVLPTAWIAWRMIRKSYG